MRTIFHKIKIVSVDEVTVGFRPGEVFSPDGTTPQDAWAAGITVLQDDDHWTNRIECYGHTRNEAVALRDYLLKNLENSHADG